jgi:hypothetical protein
MCSRLFEKPQLPNIQPIRHSYIQYVCFISFFMPQTGRKKEGSQTDRQLAHPTLPATHPHTHSLFLNADIISKNHMHLIHKYTSVFDFCNVVLCCWVNSSWCFKTTQCLHHKGHRAQKYWIVTILLWKPQILHMCLNQHFAFSFLTLP